MPGPASTRGHRQGQASARHIEQLEPDLVINSFSEIGGPLAAEAAGVPHIMFLAGADNWFHRFRPAIQRHHGDADWLVRDGLVVAEVPGWSAAPVADLDVTWLQPADIAPPTSTWSNTARPMLHVTLGTVFNTLARPLFKILAAGAANSSPWENSLRGVMASSATPAGGR